ncbi:MAG: MtN3 and saliva related transmembrane protein [Candidatus Paceibacteria bacterium]|jgi:MtN3 and saliva related transmembrane protein
MYMVIGYIAAFCTTVAYIPQAIKIIRTKDTKSISLWMYIVVTIGVLSWLIYGIFIKDTPLVIANFVTFLFTLTILIMKIRYD